MRLFRQLPNDNFVFLREGRCSYMDALMESDIAISIGFTSPGLDAKILGKASIYYSGMKEVGQVFREVPGFVADSQSELTRLFEKAAEAHRAGEMEFDDRIRKLDPYLDGGARNRIIEALA